MSRTPWYDGVHLRRRADLARQRSRAEPMTLANFKASNHSQQTAKRGADDAVDAVLGRGDTEAQEVAP